MIHPIVTYGNPLLRTPSQEIQQGTKLNLQQLIVDMFETMHKAKGIGLSAIQIGVPLRIFVIEAEEKEQNFYFKGVFINPVITKSWGSWLPMTEGCLSIPGLTAQVNRPDNIELTWYDENWEKHTQEFRDMKARIIQHEYDHLEGVIFPDKLSGMWADLLEEPLEYIRNNDIKVPYLIK